MKKLLIISALLQLYGYTLIAQETKDLLKLSLDDLLNVEIISASKKVEMLFDSPLSASVITEQQIKNSGATSIPEVLRLAPGLIVREQSPGNFDVHIRGFDNVPPESEFNESTNSTTLVMINNRVVYNYFAGGTFWESIPIDINSIEKIEIIRGPSAALYGPNAVTGVIHIITKQPQENGAKLKSSIQAGSFRSTMGYQAYEYKKDNFDISVSTNFELRERQKKDYFELKRGIYVNSPGKLLGYITGTTTDNISVRYPDPELAVQKMGINSFLNYKVSDNFVLALNTGYQNSTVQKVFVDTRRTPLTTNDSKTAYVDAITKYKDLTTQVSYLSGKQNTKGSIGWGYHLNTLDLNSEYNYKNGNLSLRPGLSYRMAHYGGQFIGGHRNIITTALSLRSEYSFNGLRFILAIRGDKYNHPNDPYLSIQSSVSYSIEQNNIVRFVYSRSHRDPFILRSYLDKVILAPGTKIINKGNKNLKLLTMDMFEIGYRSNLSQDIRFDLEGFYSKSADYSDTIEMFDFMGDSLFTLVNEYLNTKLKVNQMGASINIEYIFNQMFMLSTFATIQKTDIEDFQPHLSTIPDSVLNFENKATPTVYGGFNINYQPDKEWNLNLNGYFYSDQTFRHLTGKANIPSKLILNSKVTYTVNKNAKVYLNVRNMLNDNDNEFVFADKIGIQFLAGTDFTF